MYLEKMKRTEIILKLHIFDFVTLFNVFFEQSVLLFSIKKVFFFHPFGFVCNIWERKHDRNVIMITFPSTQSRKPTRFIHSKLPTYVTYFFLMINNVKIGLFVSASFLPFFFLFVEVKTWKGCVIFNFIRMTLIHFELIKLPLERNYTIFRDTIHLTGSHCGPLWFEWMNEN